VSCLLLLCIVCNSCMAKSDLALSYPFQLWRGDV